LNSQVNKIIRKME